MQQTNGDMGGLLIPAIASLCVPSPILSSSGGWVCQDNWCFCCRMLSGCPSQLVPRNLMSFLCPSSRLWPCFYDKCFKMCNFHTFCPRFPENPCEECIKKKNRLKSGIKFEIKMDVLLSTSSWFLHLLSNASSAGGEHGGQGGGAEGADGPDQLHVCVIGRNRRDDHPVVLREWIPAHTSTLGGGTWKLSLIFLSAL